LQAGEVAHSSQLQHPIRNSQQGQTMISSCVECPQYVVKEIEPELPAFCLYWREGLLLEAPTCRNYKEGQIPKEPVSPVSYLATAAPHCGHGKVADFQESSHLSDQHSSHQGNGDIVQSPQEAQPEADLLPGRHHVEIISVEGYMHNFQDYRGPRARLKMKVLEGPDAGKFLFDNISMFHPKESKGMLQRRIRIAYHLRLIALRTEGIVQINWKVLEGIVCWVDLVHRKFKGHQFAMVDNYHSALQPKSVD